MRLSNLFFTTLRDDPSEAEMPSHRLLLRAGYVRQLGAGIYSLLPLGFRVNKRVEQVIREEMNAIGGQEMEMPVVHPADLWRETGRYDAIGPEMARFKDRGDRDMVLAMTHEEVVADLLRDIVRSYRQLPIIVYHFQTKFRDEPRSRGGLIRVREFVMKDSYTCDRDEAGLDAATGRTTGAYTRIFERLGLKADRRQLRRRHDGRLAGPRVHGPQPGRRGRARPVRGVRLRVQPPDRPDDARRSRRRRSSCRSRRSRRPTRPRSTRSPTFLGVPTSRTAKATFFVTGDGRFVVAIVRGDYDVNETKLVNAIKAVGGLRPAQVEEIKARGMEAGYGSPIGARDAVVVVDALVAQSPNLVAGANRPGYHLRNVNVAARLHAGRGRRHRERPRGRSPAPSCGGPVILRNGIEVGNIFKLGTKYTEALGAEYLGEDGERHPIVMGSYGIGLGPQRGVHRRGPPRREGHRVARGGRAVPRAPRRASAPTRTRR